VLRRGAVRHGVRDGEVEGSKTERRAPLVEPDPQ
jgi:hypothetical protein